MLSKLFYRTVSKTSKSYHPQNECIFPLIIAISKYQGVKQKLSCSIVLSKTDIYLEKNEVLDLLELNYYLRTGTVLIYNFHEDSNLFNIT